MDIQRRQKYSGLGKTAVKNDTKINLNFDISALTLMCSYVVSENRNVRRSHLINIRNLFEIIDLDTYKNNPDKLKRIDFIRKGLEAKLVAGLDNTIAIIKYINGGLLDDDIINAEEFRDLSTNDINWVNETVSESLKYSFIYNDIDKMLDVGTRFKASDYKNRGEIVREVESVVDSMKNQFRQAKVETQSNMIFSLRNGVFEDKIKEIHKIVTDPSRGIICGMQGVNEMVGGKFENTRVYLLLGLTGVGKSLTLLNLAYQFKKYNKEYKTKDPSKIPVVVYLTMENTVEETVERLFQLAAGGVKMGDHTPEDVINRLRVDGELYLTDDSPVDIIIKYVPNQSVDTGYLYTLTEDLEDEGYEVIVLLQDHIKRIRSVNRYADLRIELGAIVNEFKVYAQLKDTIVITNSHLNRSGAQVIDSGDVRNKADLTRQLGRANIGESMLMLDNSDGGYIINDAYDSTGNKYMVFKKVKSRVNSSVSYMCQPFSVDNGIKLLEDAHLPVPLYKESLEDPMPNRLFNNGLNNNNSINQQNQIKNIEDILKSNSNSKFTDENIFQTASKYSSQSAIYNIDGEYIEEGKLSIPMVAGIASKPVLQPAIVFI